MTCLQGSIRPCPVGAEPKRGIKVRGGLVRLPRLGRRLRGRTLGGEGPSSAPRPPQVKSYLRPLRQQRPSTTASTRARHGDRVQDPVDKHRLLKTLLVPNLPRRSHRIGLALLYVRSCQNEEPEKLLDVKVRSVFVRRTRGYQSRAPGLAGASDGISSNVVDVSMSLLTQCDQPRHIAPPG